MRTVYSYAILMLFIFTACSEREQVQVERMDLVQGVYASGNVMPEGHYEVRSKVSGIVDEIMVDAGEEVEVGTPLLKLRNQPTESNLRITKNQLELARKNARPDSDLLRQLSQQVENSRVVFTQDSIDLERYRQLRKDNIGSARDLDRARLQYQTSLNNYQIAVSKLQETRDRLQVELDNARNNYLAQESRTGDYTILSALDGKVYDIIPSEGELIAGNQPIMELGAANRFETELQVDETDIIMVKQGQPVYYDLDAIEQTAKVIASIDASGYPMYPGMALEANIVISEKKNVLVLPVNYITGDNEVVMEDNRRKKVETGIRDLTYVEITSGLQEGDVILKPEP